MDMKHVKTCKGVKKRAESPPLGSPSCRTLRRQPSPRLLLSPWHHRAARTSSSAPSPHSCEVRPPRLAPSRHSRHLRGSSIRRCRPRAIMRTSSRCSEEAARRRKCLGPRQINRGCPETGRPTWRAEEVPGVNRPRGRPTRAGEVPSLFPGVNRPRGRSLVPQAVHDRPRGHPVRRFRRPAVRILPEGGRKERALS